MDRVRAYVSPVRRSTHDFRSVAYVVFASVLAACNSADSSGAIPVSDAEISETAEENDASAATTSSPETKTQVEQAPTATTSQVASTTTVVEPKAGARCSSAGDTSGSFECRQSVAGLVWMSTEITDPRTDGFGPDELCKLPDRRTEPISSAEVGLVIGFPLSLSGVRTPSVGTATLAAVAVDFPDYRGNKRELVRLRESAASFDSWLAIESNGRLSATWQIHEEWITMSKPAADYKVQGFDTEAYQELSTEIVDRVLEVMELRDLDELFVYFPDSITNQDRQLDNAFESILPQIGLPDRENGVFNYSRLRNMKGSGTISKRNGNVLWAIWAHEFLHALGLQLHGPEPSALIDAGSNYSFAVSAWSKWLLGWLDDDQIACIPTDALPAEVDLVPIETDPAVDGIRAAIVPLTETSAIFIESHRATGHSANNGFGNGLGIGDLGTYGIVVEYLDSDETAPYDPFTNDDSAGTRFLYPAELQAGARGNYGTMAREEWPIQPLTFLGETVETPQVNIDFTASTGFDSITITAKS